MSTSNIARIPLDLPAADKAELTRLAWERHERKVNPMLRIIIRDWVAAEQAAELDEAAA